jgi:hypoxia up-regulated 1
MIQQAVKSTAGEDKVAVNVNADEAAVLGAGLYGAGLSRQFKTKDIKVSDVYMYDIQASYTTVPKDGGSLKTITSTICPPSSKTGSKKTLTFKRKSDFSIKLLYKKMPFMCVIVIRTVASSLTRPSHPAIILKESSKLKSSVSPKLLPT